MSNDIDTSSLYDKVAFAKLLDLRREFAEGGISRMVLDARPELTNNFENVHGGVIMTMLDMAMSSMVMMTPPCTFSKLLVSSGRASSTMREIPPSANSRRRSSSLAKATLS